MKQYYSPIMKIVSFNDESVVTNNASMTALQEWTDGVQNSNATITRSVNFDNALKLVF